MRPSFHSASRSVGALVLAVAVLASPAACGGLAGNRAMLAGSAAPGSPMTSAAAKDADDSPAQGETWKRSQIVPNASRLMIGEREELPLRAMQTRVTIDGFRARVVTDYFFANDRGGSYEGTFQLRLPDEAAPYFFAFGESTAPETPTATAAPQQQPQAPAGTAEAPIAEDPRARAATGAQVSRNQPLEIMTDRAASWTHPKEARMVPKDKAAFAYGEVVRRRVDPALLEWQGAGVFSARVFPLAAHKVHRIVVGYDVDLSKIGQDLEYRFDLPEKAVPTVVDIAVADLGNVQIVATPATAAANVPAARARAFHFENPKERTLTVRLTSPGPSVLLGADAKTGDHFAASIAFQPSALSATTTATTQGSEQAVFLVDTSLSSNPDKFNVWLKLLQAVLERNRDTLKRFAVQFFNVETTWWRPELVENTPENVSAVLAFAGELALEGATDIGAALREAARPGWSQAQQPKWDVFLLSDGAATWGESDPYALSRVLGSGSAGPLFAYKTGLLGTDVAIMKHLARESGGAVFTVAGEAEVVAAATAHRARPWQLVDMKVEGASDLLLAGRPKTLFPGQSLMLVGRGAPAAGADALLTVERDGKTEVVRAKLGHRVPSSLAPRAYGVVAVGQLEDFDAATEPTSKAYATHFRVTGRTCSLLMLDSEEEYRRYRIDPEADAYVVKQTPAADLVAKTLRAIGATLGDPKAAFLALVAKLQHTPGVRFEAPAAYRVAIDQMPASAFDVESPPLATRQHERRHVSPELRGELASHRLDYDGISREARQRLQQLGPGDALKALSSLVEENPGDAVLARDVGFSALEWGLRGQAFHLFRRVAAARPHEPQTYRAMAQALTAMNRTDLALAYYEIGLIGEWDPRFGELRAILEMDYLRFLRRIAGGNLKTSVPEYARERLLAMSRRVGISRADLVVMITWNTDNTDVDLHVVEPSGEECFYSHPRTESGGALTKDVTRGYGPEMYVLKDAPRGAYLIRAKYYASDGNRASARTKVYATVFENWGTAQERVTEKVVTLETGKEMHDIAIVKR